MSDFRERYPKLSASCDTHCSKKTRGSFCTKCPIRGDCGSAHTRLSTMKPPRYAAQWPLEMAKLEALLR